MISVSNLNTNTTFSRWFIRFLILLAAFVTTIGILGAMSVGIESDWLAFYSAGYGLIHGHASQLYDFPTVQSWQAPYIGNDFTPYLYAPAYAIFFLPLAIPPILVARFLWLVVNLLACFAVLKLSIKWTGLDIWKSLLILASFTPLSFSLVVGQISPITMLLFACLAVLEWREEKGFLSGILAGIALYKPQLLIPIVLLWCIKLRWRSLIGLVLSAFVIVLSSLLISTTATINYMKLATEFIHLPDGHEQANAAFFAISPILAILVSTVTMIILISLTRKAKLDRYRLAMLWLAPIIVTPYVGAYDLLLLALPVSFLAPCLLRDHALQASVALVWFTPLLTFVTQDIHPVTWSALLLFTCCAWRAVHTGWWATHSTWARSS